VRHAFLLDPLPGLDVEKDTTVAFIREARGRGHEVWTGGIDRLGLAQGGHPFAWLAPTDVQEKLFALRFPSVCPESIVSRNIDEHLEFRSKLGGEMIIKPLGGAGGEGVFHLTPEDRNVRAILEVATRHGTEYQLAQRYIPEVRDGDKRIILLEGEPIGAVLRVPRHWETRANFHVGGTAERTTLTPRDREICDTIGPTLAGIGVLFAGIDVIGDWLTEINVTSPTGIREIHDLEGVRLEIQVLDAVERRLADLRKEGGVRGGES
jgi:glutathione synthase